MISRHAFGSRLRTQRERRGVTLESIADSTKIKRSLLEALERGDASQWPRGLFRRAYIRDYACAIGLPAEPLVAEFVRLFPDDGSPVSDDNFEAAHEPMRLAFAIEPDTRVRRLAAQAASAAAELGGVAVAGVVVSVWHRVDVARPPAVRWRWSTIRWRRRSRDESCRPSTCAAS